jgi:hypothetical protein
MGAKQRSEPSGFLYVSFSPQAAEKTAFGPDGNVGWSLLIDPGGGQNGPHGC